MKQIQAVFLSIVAIGFLSLVISNVTRADTVYVSNSGSDTIGVITSSGTFTFGSSSDLNDPTGLAFDPLNGNLFVANGGSGNIAEFTAGGTLITSSYATGLSDPTGLAFDRAGNLYVAENHIGRVEEIMPGLSDLTAGSESLFASKLRGPEGLAFDSAGNLFVANGWNKRITVITPEGIPGNVTVTGPQVDMPYGLAFDSHGDLFVANQCHRSIEEIRKGGIGSIFVGGGAPAGLAFDSAGYLYATDPVDDTVTKYNSMGKAVASFSTDGSGPSFITTLPDTLSVPEPSTYALLAAGLGLLIFQGRRKAGKTGNSSPK